MAATSQGPFEQRRQRLIGELGGNAFLVFNNENADPHAFYYLSGFRGEGVLLLSAKGSVLLTDQRYLNLAQRSNLGLDVLDAARDYYAAISRWVADMGIRSVALSASQTSVSRMQRIDQRIAARVVPIDDPTLALRSIKDDAEVRRIVEAIRLTETALDKLLQGRIAGQSERDLALDLEIEMRRQGAESLAFPLIVASGPHTENAHHVPGIRALQSGDLLLIDAGARFEGYCADLSRTYSIGTPSPEAQALYRNVYEAQCLARASLHDNALTSDVTETVRQLFHRQGHSDRLAHGIGHGVGLAVHEAPELSKGSITLRTGTVLAVEPGLYRPGVGGVRIEEMVRVQPEGVELLTSPAPKDLPRLPV